MTANINDKNETPEVVARRAAGAEGKLWCITVLCKLGAGTRRWVRINLYYSELLKFREDIFIYGVMLQNDPRHYTVIPPWDLIEITAERQMGVLSYDPTKE